MTKLSYVRLSIECGIEWHNIYIITRKENNTPKVQNCISCHW